MKHYRPTEIDAKVASELGAGWLGVKISRYYLVINRRLGIAGDTTQATTLEQSIALAKAAVAAKGCHAARTGEGYWTCDVPGGCVDCRALAAEIDDRDVEWFTTA